MKKKIEFRRLSILVLPILTITILSMARDLVYQNPEWISPKWTDTIRNPLKGDNESILGGKKIYTQQCIDCHGEKGKGDGVLSFDLTPKPSDFGSIKFQNQSDGAIFWKITNGNRPMPAFGGVLSTKERWRAINYVRTFINKSH
jgi:mono/diheme cytochrome c family protein